MIYEFAGGRFPEYLKHGNASLFIQPAALHFCRGKGLDIGAGKWPLPGAIPVDLASGGDAMNLPEGQYPYVFSSHCLEHLVNPVAAIEHWKSRIQPGGVLFLYLPHAEAMPYWRPQHCRKHLHQWRPHEIQQMLGDLGFEKIIRTEGWDSYWSFMAIGFVPLPAQTHDSKFRWLATENADHIHGDPKLGPALKRFGVDLLRRSSAAEKDFEDIIKRCGFRGKRCVEIGTYNGCTAIVLSRYFDEVVSIDIFPHTIKHTLAEFCGAKNIRFVDVRDNDEKAALIKTLTFDAAFVDGNHELDTASDFDLVRHGGRVLFHEYWPQQRPVWDLVNSLKSSGRVDIEGKFALWTAS